MSISTKKRPAMFWALSLAALALLIFFFLYAEAIAQSWAKLVMQVQFSQRDLHQQLSSAMRSIAAEGQQGISMGGLALIALSFLYGVLHAAGPGHGKVIISTYLLTQESTVRRGVLLSLASAFVQGISAVLLVEIMAGLLGLGFRRAEAASQGLEAFSYALIILVGLILAITRGQSLFKKLYPKPEDHSHAAHAQDLSCSHCVHAHAPSAVAVASANSLRSVVGLILSVGLRPCTGAMLVLLMAHALQLRLVGIAAVFAMSLGTGLTVCLLALFSFYARKASLRMAEQLPNRASHITMAADTVALAGGILISLFGALLLQAALSAPAHPLL